MIAFGKKIFFDICAKKYGTNGFDNKTKRENDDEITRNIVDKLHFISAKLLVKFKLECMVFLKKKNSICCRNIRKLHFDRQTRECSYKGSVYSTARTPRILMSIKVNRNKKILKKKMS